MRFSLRISALLICLVFLACLDLAANGQIAVDKMAPAQTFEPGISGLGETGLDSALWQGTSAARAGRLLSRVPGQLNPPARDLIKTVIFSGGVPPKAASRQSYQDWQAARLDLVLRLGELQAFDALLAKTEAQDISPNPTLLKVRFERAVLGGDVKQACVLADQNRLNRKAPFWAKARGFCHLMRGEIPAAELTLDLLERDGVKDPAYKALMNRLLGAKNKVRNLKVKTPMQMALLRHIFRQDKALYKAWPVRALPPVLAKETLETTIDDKHKLEALKQAAPVLDVNTLKAVLVHFAGGVKTETPAANLKAKSWDSALWGAAWTQAHTASDKALQANAIAALLRQARRFGFEGVMAEALNDEIATLSNEIKSQTDARSFARLAVLHSDIPALQGLFAALPEDDPERARIALASDALGGGFMLGGLGVDIKDRLAEKTGRARAMRDAYIASALGARIDAEAEDILLRARPGGKRAPAGALLLLLDAAARSARAETLLRAGLIFNTVPPARLPSDDFGLILRTLMAAGLTKQAGQIAALDYLTP